MTTPYFSCRTEPLLRTLSLLVSFCDVAPAILPLRTHPHWAFTGAMSLSAAPRDASARIACPLPFIARRVTKGHPPATYTSRRAGMLVVPCSKHTGRPLYSIRSHQGHFPLLASNSLFSEMNPCICIDIVHNWRIYVNGLLDFSFLAYCAMVVFRKPDHRQSQWTLSIFGCRPHAGKGPRRAAPHRTIG